MAITHSFARRQARALTISPSPAQLRAARAMLGWSMLDLAQAAGLSISTIKRVEDLQLQPIAGYKRSSIQSALEAAGIRFLADDGQGPGLRLRVDAQRMNPGKPP